jgi:hypothetical protein
MASDRKYEIAAAREKAMVAVQAIFDRCVCSFESKENSTRYISDSNQSPDGTSSPTMLTTRALNAMLCAPAR